MEETQLNNYKVLIRCSTYNHSDYIKETLNGFVIQKTNFPFLCLIMDDASTDGEQLLIKKFIEDECDPNRTKIISNDDIAEVVMAHHRANPNCVLLAYLLKINLYGTGKKEPLIKPWQNLCKYIALCEGDDYWTDPYKLQKQVDFLEANPEYGLVHTSIKRYIQSKNEFINDERKFTISGDALESLILGESYIATLTVCFRAELLNKIDTSYTKESFMMGDYPQWIEMSRLCKIHYIPDVTSVYRVLENSASHSKNQLNIYKFQADVWRIRLFFVKKYGIKHLFEYIHNEYLFNVALVKILEKKYLEGLKAYKASKMYSRILTTLKFFIKSIK